MKQPTNLAALIAAGGWGKLSHEFLSLKAKHQLRDKHGRFIKMNSLVRWMGEDGKTYHRGEVDGFSEDLTHVKVKESSPGHGQHSLLPKQLEVIKAVIPTAPGEPTPVHPTSLHEGDHVKVAKNGPTWKVTKPFAENHTGSGHGHVAVENADTGTQGKLTGHKDNTNWTVDKLPPKTEPAVLTKSADDLNVGDVLVDKNGSPIGTVTHKKYKLGGYDLVIQHPDGTEEKRSTLQSKSFEVKNPNSTDGASHELVGPEGDHPDTGLYLNTDGFKKVGGQAGSNSGGFYEAPDGTRYYIKKAQSEQHAANEIAAARIYQMAGVNVPDVYLTDQNGEPAIASKVIPGLDKLYPGGKTDAATLAEGRKGFAVDAWLGNWDSIGLEYDNMMKDQQGHAVRVDTGGALLYRAQGSPKGGLFGDTVGETKTLRDKDMNPQAAKVFGGMTDAQLKQDVQDTVDTVDEAKVNHLIDQLPFSNQSTKDALKKTLAARKDDLNKQVGITLSGPAGQHAIDPQNDPIQLDAKSVDNFLKNGPGAPSTSSADGPLVKQSDLTPDEVASIKKYTQNAYGPINAHLRKGELSSNPKYTPDVIEEHVKNLDSAIVKSQSTKDAVLYRGASGSGILPADIVPGSILDDKGFVSTTTDFSVAKKGFASKNDTETVLFEFHAPAGSHMLDVDKTGSSVAIAGQSESEFVLPRGSQFKVTSITTGPDGTRHVVADLLQHEVPTSSLSPVTDMSALKKGDVLYLKNGKAVKTKDAPAPWGPDSSKVSTPYKYVDGNYQGTHIGPKDNSDGWFLTKSPDAPAKDTFGPTPSSELKQGDLVEMTGPGGGTAEVIEPFSTADGAVKMHLLTGPNAGKDVGGTVPADKSWEKIDPASDAGKAALDGKANLVPVPAPGEPVGKFGPDGVATHPAAADNLAQGDFIKTGGAVYHVDTPWSNKSKSVALTNVQTGEKKTFPAPAGKLFTKFEGTPTAAKDFTPHEPAKVDTAGTKVFSADKFQPPHVQQPKEYASFEQAGLENYVEDGGYTDINGFLRHGKNHELGFYSDSEELQKDVQAIDSALEDSVVQNDGIVYRGAGKGVLPSGPIAPGTILSDKGFLSTSADINIAKGFAHDNGNKSEHVLFEIHVPAGARAINMDATEHGAHEHEFLFPRNTQLQVTEEGVHKDGTRYVVAKLLPDGAPAAPHTDATPAGLPGNLDPANTEATSLHELKPGDYVTLHNGTVAQLAETKNNYNIAVFKGISGPDAGKNVELSSYKTKKFDKILPAGAVSHDTPAPQNYDKGGPHSTPSVNQPKLSDSQANAALIYTGSGYAGINSYLRTGTPAGGWHASTSLDDAVHNLDSAIAQSTSTKDSVLYRGANFPDQQNIEPGSVISDKGFLSTTSFYTTAKKDFTTSQGDNGYIFEIHAPAGSQMLDAGKAGSLHNENEFILPRNSSLKVKETGVQSDGTRYIIADLVPNGATHDGTQEKLGHDTGGAPEGAPGAPDLGPGGHHGDTPAVPGEGQAPGEVTPGYQSADHLASLIEAQGVPMEEHGLNSDGNQQHLKSWLSTYLDRVYNGQFEETPQVADAVKNLADELGVPVPTDNAKVTKAADFTPASELHSGDKVYWNGKSGTVSLVIPNGDGTYSASFKPDDGSSPTFAILTSDSLVPVTDALPTEPDTTPKVPVGSLSVGDTFQSNGKSWTITEIQNVEGLTGAKKLTVEDVSGKEVTYSQPADAMFHVTKKAAPASPSPHSPGEHTDTAATGATLVPGSDHVYKDAQGEFVITKNGHTLRVGDTVTSTKDGLSGKIVALEKGPHYVKVQGPDGKVKGRQMDTLVPAEKHVPEPTPTAPAPAADMPKHSSLPGSSLAVGDTLTYSSGHPIGVISSPIAKAGGGTSWTVTSPTGSVYTMTTLDHTKYNVIKGEAPAAPDTPTPDAAHAGPGQINVGDKLVTNTGDHVTVVHTSKTPDGWTHVQYDKATGGKGAHAVPPQGDDFFQAPAEEKTNTPDTGSTDYTPTSVADWKVGDQVKFKSGQTYTIKSINDAGSKVEVQFTSDSTGQDLAYPNKYHKDLSFDTKPSEHSAPNAPSAPSSEPVPVTAGSLKVGDKITDVDGDPGTITQIETKDNGNLKFTYTVEKYPGEPFIANLHPSNKTWFKKADSAAPGAADAVPSGPVSPQDLKPGDTVTVDGFTGVVKSTKPVSLNLTEVTYADATGHDHTQQVWNYDKGVFTKTNGPAPSASDGPQIQNLTEPAASDIYNGLQPGEKVPPADMKPGMLLKGGVSGNTYKVESDPTPTFGVPGTYKVQMTNLETGVSSEKHIKETSKYLVPDKADQPSVPSAPGSTPAPAGTVKPKDVKIGDWVTLPNGSTIKVSMAEKSLGYPNSTFVSGETKDFELKSSHVANDTNLALGAPDAAAPAAPSGTLVPGSSHVYQDAQGRYVITSKGYILREGMQIISTKDGHAGTIHKFELGPKYAKVKGPDGKIKGRQIDTLKPVDPNAPKATSLPDASGKVAAPTPGVHSNVNTPGEMPPELKGKGFVLSGTSMPENFQPGDIVGKNKQLVEWAKPNTVKPTKMDVKFKDQPGPLTLHKTSSWEKWEVSLPGVTGVKKPNQFDIGDVVGQTEGDKKVVKQTSEWGDTPGHIDVLFQGDPTWHSIPEDAKYYTWPHGTPASPSPASTPDTPSGPVQLSHDPINHSFPEGGEVSIPAGGALYKGGYWSDNKPVLSDGFGNSWKVDPATGETIKLPPHLANYYKAHFSAGNTLTKNENQPDVTPNIAGVYSPEELTALKADIQKKINETDSYYSTKSSMTALLKLLNDPSGASLSNDEWKYANNAATGQGHVLGKESDDPQWTKLGLEVIKTQKQVTGTYNGEWSTSNGNYNQYHFAANERKALSALNLSTDAQALVDSKGTAPGKNPSAAAEIHAAISDPANAAVVDDLFGHGTSALIRKKLEGSAFRPALSGPGSPHAKPSPELPHSQGKNGEFISLGDNVIAADGQGGQVVLVTADGKLRVRRSDGTHFTRKANAFSVTGTPVKSSKPTPKQMAEAGTYKPKPRPEFQVPDWSKGGIGGTSSPAQALEKIKQSNEAGNVGWSFAAGGSQVEDMDVHVARIKNKQGVEQIELKFKLTPKQGNSVWKMHSADEAWTESNVAIEHRQTTSKDQLAQLTGTHNFHSSGGITMTRTLANGGEIKFHRAKSQQMNKQGSNPVAFHNMVQIRLPADATQSDIAKAMYDAGVDNPSAPTYEDLKRLGENKLMSLFGRKTNAWTGNDSLSSAIRLQTLDQIEKEWGVTAADLQIAQGANGRFEIRLPQWMADKVQAKTKVNYFTHQLSGGPGDLHKKVGTTGFDAMLSTSVRWSEGLKYNGSSSHEDVSTGGADYVFTRPKQTLAPLSGSIVFDASRLFTRMDWFTRTHDAWGKRESSMDIIGDTSPNATETMFKHRLDLADAVGYVVSYPSDRQQIIDNLKAAGITEMGGRPVEDFIILAPNTNIKAPTPSVPTVPISSLAPAPVDAAPAGATP